MKCHHFDISAPINNATSSPQCRATEAKNLLLRACSALLQAFTRLTLLTQAVVDSYRRVVALAARRRGDRGSVDCRKRRQPHMLARRSHGQMLGSGFVIIHQPPGVRCLNGHGSFGLLNHTFQGVHALSTHLPPHPLIDNEERWDQQAAGTRKGTLESDVPYVCPKSESA